MILTLGFVVVALLLLTVVVSAAGVHLERKRLLALADLLALEGADAVGDNRYFVPGRRPGGAGAGGVPLTDASVRASVDRYLRDNPAAADGAGTSSRSSTRRRPTAGPRRCAWVRWSGRCS